MVAPLQYDLAMRLRSCESLVTVTDPKAYTRPWTLNVKQVAVADTEMLDAICLENEKDVPHLPGK